MSISWAITLPGSVLAFTLLSNFCAPSAALAATVLQVPQEYATIQAAINAAADGDSVRVSPGTYVEVLDFLGKNIIVESTSGAPVTIIDGGGTDTVVRMIAAAGQAPTCRPPR